jgi:hypothetical protein
LKRLLPAAFALALLPTASTVGGCFDTRLIPEDSDNEAGASGAAGKPTGTSGASSASGASQQGGDAGATSGGTSGGDADVFAAGQAGAAPAGGGPTTGGVTWLTLVGSRAPSSEPTNAALGIDGALYAYADGCATWDYDSSTRCVRGRLCTTGVDFENWGVAVGFDFHATGPDGSPPDSKLVWNPDAVGVRGVTWRIRGNAPGLQLWVLNMEPRFRGQCPEQTCEIAGPPDGAATPSLQGTLLFEQMVKDYWGGRGEAYTYDPAAVFALQFKLPAVNVGSASFDFCIDAVGVVR